MEIVISEQKKSERKLPEPGLALGILYSVVHMGTQKTNFENKVDWKPKVRFGFELPEQTDEFTVEENGKKQVVIKPLVVSIETTASLGEKATLRKILEQWRGKALTREETNNFSLSPLLGKPAMLSLVHQTSQAGNVYCKIQGLSKVPKGVVVPAKTYNPLIEYNIKEMEGGQFSSLPEWIQNQIRKSKEFIEASGDNVPF